MVQREREEEEKERLKEQEERKRKALEMKWKKQILEASFDGENDVIEAVLNEVSLKMTRVANLILYKHITSNFILY